MEVKSENGKLHDGICDWFHSCPIYGEHERSEKLPCLRCLAELKKHVGEEKLQRRLRSYLKRLLKTSANSEATAREWVDCLNGLVRDLYATYAAGWADSGPHPFGVITGCAWLDTSLFPLGHPAYLCLLSEPDEDTARILRRKGYLLENLLRVVADISLPKPEHAITDNFGSVFSFAKNEHSSLTYIAAWNEAGKLVSRYRKHLLDARTRQALEHVPDRLVQVFREKIAGLAVDNYNIVFSSWGEIITDASGYIIVLVEYNKLKNIIAGLNAHYSSGFNGKMLLLPCCLTKSYIKQAETRISQLQTAIDKYDILRGNVKFLQPIILPGKTHAKIPDGMGASLEAIVAALNANPNFKTVPMLPEGNTFLPRMREECIRSIIARKVMELLEWRSNKQVSDIRNYSKRVEQLFKLEYLIIHTDRKNLELPDFFGRRSNVHPERQKWYVMPNEKDRHEFNNASYLLALMLAKIDYAVDPKTTSEKSIQTEAVGIRRALKRLFTPATGKRLTKRTGKKTDALPKKAPRLLSLQAWIENHIDCHARNWPPEVQKAFRRRSCHHSGMMKLVK